MSLWTAPQWEQQSLLPPDRVHLRWDVYIVGADPLGRVTSTLREGVSDSYVWLQTAAIELDPTGIELGGRHFSAELDAALRRCSPF